jgi:hypothetical protein
MARASGKPKVAGSPSRQGLISLADLDALLAVDDDAAMRAEMEAGWLTVADWAQSWGITEIHARKRLRASVAKGIMEQGRRRFRRSTGAIYTATAYRMKK